MELEERKRFGPTPAIWQEANKTGRKRKQEWFLPTNVRNFSCRNKQTSVTESWQENHFLLPHPRKQVATASV